MLGLSDRMAHYPSVLSGGQQQRVAIVRAVIVDPMVLVAGERTGDLDRQSAADVLELTDQLAIQLGKTVIMVTQDQRAASAAHRLIHLEKVVATDGQA
jgi:putative ABC transport system ATP-binding protein